MGIDQAVAITLIMSLISALSFIVENFHRNYIAV
jgi:hypothetical protein